MFENLKQAQRTGVTPRERLRLTLPFLETRIHRFALESKHSEHAFMHATKRFSIHETGQPLYPETKLADRQAPLA